MRTSVETVAIAMAQHEDRPWDQLAEKHSMNRDPRDCRDHWRDLAVCAINAYERWVQR